MTLRQGQAIFTQYIAALLIFSTCDVFDLQVQVIVIFIRCPGPDTVCFS